MLREGHTHPDVTEGSLAKARDSLAAGAIRHNQAQGVGSVDFLVESAGSQCLQSSDPGALLL